MHDEAIAGLQQRIGYRFSGTTLLREALTHRSYANERRDSDGIDNQRLEFLGDAVLGLVVGEQLYSRFAGLPEGELTRIRAETVNAGALAQAARAIGLGTALLLGKGEEKSGGRTKENILADALEAILGAIYLDGGLEAVRPVVLQLLGDRVLAAASRQVGTDYKTRLQEYFQARRRPAPEYVLVAAEGPVHDRLFTVEVRSDEECLALGTGRSKKEAEQQAACGALERLTS